MNTTITNVECVLRTMGLPVSKKAAELQGRPQIFVTEDAMNQHPEATGPVQMAAVLAQEWYVKNCFGVWQQSKPTNF